jgi:hypothetical protein
MVISRSKARALPHQIHIESLDADALLGQPLAKGRKVFDDRCAGILGFSLDAGRQSAVQNLDFDAERAQLRRAEPQAHFAASLVGRVEGAGHPVQEAGRIDFDRPRRFTNRCVSAGRSIRQRPARRWRIAYDADAAARLGGIREGRLASRYMDWFRAQGSDGDFFRRTGAPSIHPTAGNIR